MKPKIRNRFRSYLPVVVDVETSGVEPATDALLEVSAVIVTMNPEGKLVPSETISEHIHPFDGARLDPKSLEFNKIDPFHPFRFALPEREALENIFTPIRRALKKNQCSRAVLVGHNAWFDLLFLKAACKRASLDSPFHAFTSIDTASLCALVYGQTVLAKAMQAAHIKFDPEEAHSAIYDAKKTAELFCRIVNEYPFCLG